MDRNALREYQRAVAAYLRKHGERPTYYFPMQVVLWGAVAVCFLGMFGLKESFDWVTFGVTSALFFFLFLAWLVELTRMQHSALPSDHGLTLGRHTYEFSEDGIHAEGQGYESHFDWSSVTRIQETKSQLLLYLDTAFAIVLPKEDVGGPSLINEIVTMAKGHNNALHTDR